MQNFMQISPRETSRQMGEVHATTFIDMLFSSTHPQIRPLKGFLDDAVFYKEMFSWG